MAGKVGRFFIAGCQRSGTTLMRLVLECHPQIFCFDEDRAYAALARGDYAVPPGKRMVGFKVPRWTETLGEDLLWDEGLAEEGRAVYRGEPVVFLLRDVRDTVASMLKLRMTAEQSWLEFCARPILEAKMRPQRGRLAGSFARDLDLVRSANHALPLVGALYWKYKTQTYFDLRRRGWPVCPVRYEDLVAEPEPTLRRVVAFLGLPWDAALLDHPHGSHTEIYPDGTAMGNTDPRRPIDAASAGQWRHLLSEKDVAGVWAVAGELNERVEAECSQACFRGLRGWIRSLFPRRAG